MKLSHVCHLIYRKCFVHFNLKKYICFLLKWKLVQLVLAADVAFNFVVQIFLIGKGAYNSYNYITAFAAWNIVYWLWIRCLNYLIAVFWIWINVSSFLWHSKYD